MWPVELARAFVALGKLKPGAYEAVIAGGFAARRSGRER